MQRVISTFAHTRLHTHTLVREKGVCVACQMKITRFVLVPRLCLFGNGTLNKNPSQTYANILFAGNLYFLTATNLGKKLEDHMH